MTEDDHVERLFREWREGEVPYSGGVKRKQPEKDAYSGEHFYVSFWMHGRIIEEDARMIWREAWRACRDYHACNPTESGVKSG